MRRFSALALAAVVAFGGTIAEAHDGLAPLQDHRLLALTIDAEELTIAESIVVSPLSGGELRTAADANHDQHLDADEQRALGIAIAARVAAGLALTLDGKAQLVHAEVAEVRLDGDGTGPDAFTVTVLVRAFAEGAGEHVLALVEHTDLPRLGELQMRLETRGKARILRSSAKGEIKDGVLLFPFHVEEPCQLAKTCGLSVTFLGGTPRPRGTKPVYFVALGLVGLGVAFAIARRFRRT